MDIALCGWGVDARSYTRSTDQGNASQKLGEYYSPASRPFCRGRIRHAHRCWYLVWRADYPDIIRVDRTIMYVVSKTGFCFFFPVR